MNEKLKKATMFHVNILANKYGVRKEVMLNAIFMGWFQSDLLEIL